MSNIVINGATYKDVPSIQVPNEDGEMVEFEEKKEKSTKERLIDIYEDLGYTQVTISETKYSSSNVRDIFAKKGIITELPSFSTNSIPSISESGLCVCVDKFPNNITVIPAYAFLRCGNICFEALNDDVQVIGQQAFNSCFNLRLKQLPTKLAKIQTACFYLCQNITCEEIPSTCTEIGQSAFYGCLSIRNLIMRQHFVVENKGSSSISDTGPSKGYGYIYVPKSLVDSYKSATNWSVYANQFRALEDYTVDGTVTGELDESKI